MAIFHWQEIPADKSPFVMVFQLIGIKWAAALVNFVVLTSAGSALNSSLFSATRNLFSLAQQHDRGGLTTFKKISRNGIPLHALYLASALALFAPILTLIPQIQNAFDFAASCTTNLFLIVYFIQLVTFFKYRKSQDFDPDGFLTPKANFLVPFVFIVFVIVFISLFFNASTLYPALGAMIWTIVFGLFSHFKAI
jgi:L-asparagine transporter-like permease